MTIENNITLEDIVDVLSNIKLSDEDKAKWIHLNNVTPEDLIDAINYMTIDTAFDWFSLGVKMADKYPNWISVEEELPKEEDLYIVSNGKETSVAYWVEDEWDSFGSVITHWMPLPQSPRKEE